VFVSRSVCAAEFACKSLRLFLMTRIPFLICFVALNNAASPKKALSILIDSDSESVESESPVTTSTPSKLQLRRRVVFNSAPITVSFKPLLSLTEKDDETDDDSDDQGSTDDEIIPYVDGETGRQIFETELVPVAGDASLMLALEGKNVIMTGEDAMKLVLVTFGSFVALYGWSIFSVWLYNYFSSL
jgi:hypothetical protein